MMFWQHLLAASSLPAGTAWELITHPRTGGAGVVVNNGIAIALADSAVQVAIADASRAIVVADSQLTAVVADTPTTATFAPDVAVQITTNPIGATT
jgi:hypothetical protein